MEACRARLKSRDAPAQAACATHTQTAPTSKLAVSGGSPAVRLRNKPDAAIATSAQSTPSVVPYVDSYEQEADRAADVAMNSLSSQPVQSHPSHGNAGKGQAISASSYGGLGTGRALSTPLRTQFESAYGSDFSGVRLHTGPSPAKHADSAGAKAFTSGPHIVFGGKIDDPESSAHRRLLAHELAHVAQQQGGTNHAGAKPSTTTSPVAARLSTVPRGRVQASPTVTAVNLSAAELGRGGFISATAVAPAGVPLTWSLLGAPAGVTDAADGRPLGRRINATAAVAAGGRFRIQCALTANPRDKAPSAFITLVGITDIRFTPAPPFQPITALGWTSTGPPNTAEPNRNGIAGNTANVIVRTAPGGSPTTRSITVTLLTALGATVAGRVITTGAITGDMIVQVADDATGTTQRATLIVNSVPTAVNAFTAQAGRGSANWYGCFNTFGWAWSDATVRARNRIIGETITTRPRDDFGIAPNPGVGWNPAPTLQLAVPANQWRDQVAIAVGPKTGAAADTNAINVNRHVGPGAATPLPRISENNQGFHYSIWRAGGWSTQFDIGVHRRGLMQDGAGFIIRTEHIFPGAVAAPFNEPYKGPPIITLSNIGITPLSPAANALAADNTATASVRVNTTVPGRQVRWNAIGGGPVTFLTPAAPATPIAVNAVARLRAGAAAGGFTIRALDSVFPNRQVDGTGNIVAVALNIVSPLMQTIAAGVRTAIVDLMAEPGGRTMNWTVDAAAFARGVRVTRSSPSGAASPARRATVTRPAAFVGTVTVTATDSVLPARTINFTINFL